MTQFALDFSPPVEPFPPINGRDAVTLATSRSGATVSVEDMPSRKAWILKLLADGPKSRQDLAKPHSPFEINSICWAVKLLLEQQEIEHFDVEEHFDKRGRRTTRERLQIRRTSTFSDAEGVHP